jgi:hypothetical protein
MTSLFNKLSETDERNCFLHQTAKLTNFPLAHPRLAYVVAALQKHFLAEHWTLRINPGSAAFDHDLIPGRAVFVFVDGGNKLSDRFGLNLKPLPIVVGLDLTHHDPIERHLIREYLRANFVYVDPEMGALPAQPGNERKAQLKLSYEHYLDLVFIPDGAPCPFDIEEKRVEEIVAEIERATGVAVKP